MRTAATIVVALSALALAGAAAATHASTESGAVFCSGVDVADLRKPYAFQFGLTGDELQSRFFADGGLKSQGFRPRRLTGYRAGSTQYFATKWVQAPGPEWTARFGLTASEFGALFAQLRSTHRPIDVSGYARPGGGGAMR